MDLRSNYSVHLYPVVAAISAVGSICRYDHNQFSHELTYPQLLIPILVKNPNPSASPDLIFLLSLSIV